MCVEHCRRTVKRKLNFLVFMTGRRLTVNPHLLCCWSLHTQGVMFSPTSIFDVTQAIQGLIRFPAVCRPYINRGRKRLFRPVPRMVCLASDEVWSSLSCRSGWHKTFPRFYLMLTTESCSSGGRQTDLPAWFYNNGGHTTHFRHIGQMPRENDKFDGDSLEWMFHYLVKVHASHFLSQLCLKMN